MIWTLSSKICLYPLSSASVIVYHHFRSVDKNALQPIMVTLLDRCHNILLIFDVENSL